MKAISLWQPWATLMALGIKTVETRSWSTEHRGYLAIHATGHFPKEARDLCYESPFSDVLKLYNGHLNPEMLPRGKVLAVVNLYSVFGTTSVNPNSLNREFGDFSPGRYAWLTSNVIQLPWFVEAKGRQGLWDWDIPDRFKILFQGERKEKI
jgi:hypothetical protein